MREAGNTVISIIGARTKDLLILEEEMAKVSDVLKVSTDDGSYGYHGFVSDILQDFIDAGTHDQPGRGHRPRAHDARGLQRDPEQKHQDRRQPEPHHGGCHGDVRGLPGHGRGKDPVRLRGWAGVRRASKSILPNSSSASGPTWTRRKQAYETYHPSWWGLPGRERLMAETTEKKKRTQVPRQKMPEQEPQVRAKNFDEVPFGYTPELAKLEASRCLQCKKPDLRRGMPGLHRYSVFHRADPQEDDFPGRPASSRR